MHPALNIAVKAALRAGQIINRAALDIERLQVAVKSKHDYVTEVDRAAEAAIIETLSEAYPGYGILAEESGIAAPTRKGGFQWIIDPLDGTTNFIHGLPQYAVSIALAKDGQLQQGVVFDPAKNELFTASRGAGAYMNDRRIRVSRCQKLGAALLGTGFPYREFARAEEYLAILRQLMQHTSGIRRPGAASLDLAYVASGRLDGFWEFGLSPWDMAAGALLITEAGGLISDVSGESGYMQSGEVVAGTPKIFPLILKTVRDGKKLSQETSFA